jgi:decaprenyl-phosphate phosphoribosyltransferase
MSPDTQSPGDPPRRPLPRALIALARPHQWAKSAFVLLGPLYGLREYEGPWQPAAINTLLAAGAFALASSACYVVNDIADADQDRAHPRKRLRPIARGEVTRGQAAAFAGLLALGAAGLAAWAASPALAVIIGLYVLNVMAYSARLKHVVIADVMSLSMGFVLRVVGGCAALGIAPSTWLLNVTLFLAMFLALGKRLGERRSLGEHAENVRGVHRDYTDNLRMLVVVTAVATLITYAAYLVSRQEAGAVVRLWQPGGDVSLLWITLLPATYALLRCIVLLERGRYDDPTELVIRDWPMQAACAAFAAATAAAIAWHPAPAP